MIELKDVDVNEPAEAPESSSEETEQVETPAEEVEQVETPEEPEKPEETEVEKPQEAEVEEPKPLSPQANERFRNLANENKELKAKLEAFKSQPAPELEGDMTVEDLNRMVNERAMSAAELLIASREVGNQYQNRLNEWATDFEQVKQENPALDPESPEYDKELDATLARLMDDGTGKPRIDIKVSEVLESINRKVTDTATKAKEEGKSEATVRLAKQMAESAVTPGQKIPESDDEDEDLSELRTSNPKEWFKKL